MGFLGMSLQWTLIATFLYTEIVIIFILLLPFISPKRWQRLFKSKFAKSISNQGNVYFMVFIVILVLFFLDSIREMYRYTSLQQDADGHAHLDAEMQHNMKLFRSQRNFYIAGFSLFLSFVIRRLVTLIVAQATLLAQCEASMKQAQSATDVAQKLLKEQDKTAKDVVEAAENEGNVKREAFEQQIQKLEESLKKAIQERDHAKIDLMSMKKQAESITTEYDKLSNEHRTLQEASGKSGSKKEE